MSRRHWFRFWMAKYLDGVRGLGDELGFAYTKLFVKMYEDGGPLRFDVQQLKHLLEKRPQDVRRIVGRLVELGKLSIDNEGLIHNGKADDELAAAKCGRIENDPLISDSLTPSFPPHSKGHRAEKPNTISRAHAITRADMRLGPETDTDTPLRDVSVSPLPPSAPNEDEPSVARDLGLTPSGSQAASQPIHMANDWDLPPAPGPHGQTAFLKKYAAYKAGDTHALDPHPEIPDNGINANPQLTAKIRQQLGMDYSHAEASPDTDDDGLLRRPQQSPDPAGPETTPATARNDQAIPAPTHPGTWYADPGNTGEEGSEMKWDDDDDDSNLFKNLF